MGTVLGLRPGHPSRGSGSARGPCPPVHVGTNSWDVLKMYVHNHTITCTYFRLRADKICIIISTEVPAYPKTSPWNFFPNSVSSVVKCFPRNEKSGTVPRDMSHGIFPRKIKFTRTKIVSQEKCPRGKNSLQRQNSL